MYADRVIWSVPVFRQSVIRAKKSASIGKGGIAAALPSEVWSAAPSGLNIKPLTASETESLAAFIAPSAAAAAVLLTKCSMGVTAAFPTL